MIEFLLNIDRFLLIKINSLHWPWLDAIMYFLTDGKSWLPFFLIMIGWIIYRYRWQAVVIFLLTAVVILLADRISAGVIKPWVGRLRPTHEPGLEGILHIVNGYVGGLYSFVSSHATNAFGVAVFLWLSVRNRIPWIWIIFIWATIFSYTRIYLGVHYPSDILFGGVLGALIGLLVYKLSDLLPTKWQWQKN